MIRTLPTGKARSVPRSDRRRCFMLCHAPLERDSETFRARCPLTTLIQLDRRSYHAFPAEYSVYSCAGFFLGG